MAIAVQMRHSFNGIYKNGYIGFSWTYLFFGFFVPLIRGHYPLALWHFAFFIVFSPVLIIFQPVMAFLFNRFYTRRLIEEGYVFDDSPELVARAKTVINVK
jgi:hypothetical protein